MLYRKKILADSLCLHRPFHVHRLTLKNVIFQPVFVLIFVKFLRDKEENLAKAPVNSSLLLAKKKTLSRPCLCSGGYHSLFNPPDFPASFTVVLKKSRQNIKSHYSFTTQCKTWGRPVFGRVW